MVGLKGYRNAQKKKIVKYQWKDIKYAKKMFNISRKKLTI